MKIFPNEDFYPYEIYLSEYKEEKGTVLMAKFDHSLSDALGVIGFIISMSDNYDISFFPTMKTKIGIISKLILRHLYVALLHVVNAIRGLKVKMN